MDVGEGPCAAAANLGIWDALEGGLRRCHLRRPGEILGGDESGAVSGLAELVDFVRVFGDEVAGGNCLNLRRGRAVESQAGAYG